MKKDKFKIGDYIIIIWPENRAYHGLPGIIRNVFMDNRYSIQIGSDTEPSYNWKESFLIAYPATKFQRAMWRLP